MFLKTGLNGNLVESDCFNLYASMLYEGIEPPYIPTKYLYIVESIFRIMGENQFLAQYVNVVFWNVVT